MTLCTPRSQTTPLTATPRLRFDANEPTDSDRFLTPDQRFSDPSQTETPGGFFDNVRRVLFDTPQAEPAAMETPAAAVAETVVEAAAAAPQPSSENAPQADDIRDAVDEVTACLSAKAMEETFVEYEEEEDRLSVIFPEVTAEAIERVLVQSSAPGFSVAKRSEIRDRVTKFIEHSCAIRRLISELECAEQGTPAKRARAE